MDNSGARKIARNIYLFAKAQEYIDQHKRLKKLKNIKKRERRKTKRRWTNCDYIYISYDYHNYNACY